ncbi:MAG: hypothetical protein HOP06_09410 [Methylotenera sp.]|nr:hypothetical protein [Methylotenera sp.]
MNAQTIFTILLITMSSNAMAEWTRHSDGSEFTVYIELSTISKSGDLVKMWTLRDYKVSQNFNGRKWLSIKTQQEFNCKNMQVRSVAAILHSNNMGKGSVVKNGAFTSNWDVINPDKLRLPYQLMDNACTFGSLYEIAPERRPPK